MRWWYISVPLLRSADLPALAEVSEFGLSLLGARAQCGLTASRELPCAPVAPCARSTREHPSGCSFAAGLQRCRRPLTPARLPVGNIISPSFGGLHRRALPCPDLICAIGLSFHPSYCLRIHERVIRGTPDICYMRAQTDTVPPTH